MTSGDQVALQVDARAHKHINGHFRVESFKKNKQTNPNDKIEINCLGNTSISQQVCARTCRRSVKCQGQQLRVAGRISRIRNSVVAKTVILNSCPLQRLLRLVFGQRQILLALSNALTCQLWRAATCLRARSATSSTGGSAGERQRPVEHVL